MSPKFAEPTQCDQHVELRMFYSDYCAIHTGQFRQSREQKRLAVEFVDRLALQAAAVALAAAAGFADRQLAGPEAAAGSVWEAVSVDHLEMAALAEEDGFEQTRELSIARKLALRTFLH